MARERAAAEAFKARQKIKYTSRVRRGLGLVADLAEGACDQRHPPGWNAAKCREFDHAIAWIKQESRRGFTLLELLAAVAIIALLIALAMPALAGSREQARRARCGVQLRSGVEQLVELDRFPEPLPPAVQLVRCPSHPRDDGGAAWSHTHRGRESYAYHAWPSDFTADWGVRVFDDLRPWHDNGRNVAWGDASITWEAAP